MGYDDTRSRVELIAAVAAARSARRYLEIGVEDRTNCFDRIPAERKWGVDPADCGATHVMTSDQFFAALHPEDGRFDIVFVDGDHRHAQVARDVDNALRHLAPDGVLVMHDCFPISAKYEHRGLSGTVWRAFVQLRQRDDVEAFCGEFDHGVGVARFGKNSAPIVLPKTLDELTYDDLVGHLDQWLRFRSFDQLYRFATGS